MNKGTKFALISFGVAVIIAAIVLIVVYYKPTPRQQHPPQDQPPPTLHDILNIVEEIIEEEDNETANPCQFGTYNSVDNTCELTARSWFMLPELVLLNGSFVDLPHQFPTFDEAINACRRQGTNCFGVTLFGPAWQLIQTLSDIQLPNNFVPLDVVNAFPEAPQCPADSTNGYCFFSTNNQGRPMYQLRH